METVFQLCIHYLLWGWHWLHHWSLGWCRRMKCHGSCWVWSTLWTLHAHCWREQKGHQHRKHCYAHHSQELQEPASKWSKIPVEDPGGVLGRKVATFLHRGPFLDLDLILMWYYIKKKESCTIVPQKGEGRNRKCTSKYNKKVALENYCVIARDNYRSARVRAYF